MNHKYEWIKKQGSICGIYAIIHNASGRTYVGKSYNIADRWLTHTVALQNKSHHTKALQAEWNKGSGIIDFSFQVLEECPKNITEEELSLKEIEWWQKQTNPFNNKPRIKKNKQ